MHVMGAEYQMQYCQTIAHLARVLCTYTPAINSVYSHGNLIRSPYLETYGHQNFAIYGDTWTEV